ncbi:MAG: glycoside hydrolase family 13 protein [Nocardioidaceae bacterium]
MTHPGSVVSRDNAATPTWWESAVIYQVYIRSFSDADGDGVGDVPGLRARLGHVSSLGVDAIWVNPWYPSPMADGGYDVADYRDIDPSFGTLCDAEGLIADAHDAGLRVLLDIVPNHTSSEHPWFRALLQGDPSARARYIVRPGRGAGDEPPNDWQSTFGGPAWTRLPGTADTPGEWYLHLFAPAQPDLDWTNPEVRAEFEDILRFWFDRGADGFRIDVAHGLSKEAGLPDAGPRPPGPPHLAPHPAWDQDEVHEIYRGWRRVADSYDPPRIFVAEAWVADNTRLAQYTRPDELHTAFQFDLLRAPWRARALREVIDAALATSAEVGGSSTWVLSNHDVVREVTRYARSQPPHSVEGEWDRGRWGDEPADLELGNRRARAAALLMLALPGSAYVYQGEELGLAEVEDIPDGQRQDPTWVQSGRTDPGRDGCRVPLPWAGDGPPYAFSPDSSGQPWLPQPEAWSALTVAAQEGDPGSMLSLYRQALDLRRVWYAGAAPLVWLDSPADTVYFQRGRARCLVNLGRDEVAVPEGRVLLASGAGVEAGVVPVDTAIWLTD